MQARTGQRSARITSRVIASCFTLISFSAALFVGVVAGNPLVTVLSRALVVGAVCFVVGSVIGHVAAGVVSREIVEHERRFPLPEEGARHPDDVGGVSV